MSGTIHRTSLYRDFVLSVSSTRRICLFYSDMVALKRKSGVPGYAGAKRAKAATEYATATEPRIPGETPLSALLKAMQDHQQKISPQVGNVVHWFRSDLRLEDNRALFAAGQRAKETGKGLIALYVVSPQVEPVEGPILMRRTGDIIRRLRFESISYCGR